MIVFACALSCASTAARGPETSASAAIEPCDVAASVLRSIVKPNEEQPLGLERFCVEKHAARDGIIYVDARVSRAGQIERFSAKECRPEGFSIRFDSPDLTPSPTDSVVLLDLNRTDATTFEFVAVTEDRSWRERHARNIYSSSPCLSSSGAATRDHDGWRVTPRAPKPSETADR